MFPPTSSRLALRLPLYALLILFALVVLSSCGSPSQQAEQLLDAAERKGAFQGFAFVMTDSDTLLNRSSAPVPSLESLAMDRPVPLASLSKLITATAVLRLVDQGRIDLAAPLSRYRPEMTSPLADSITIRQLLAHRSGLPRELGAAMKPMAVAYDADGFAGPFLDEQPLERQPGAGETASYSNWGYWLLGSVLEQVTGTPFSEAIPTLLPGIHATVPHSPADRWTMGYAADGSPAQEIDLASRYSSGGMVATPHDYLSFVDALRSNHWLSDASRDLLFTSFGYEPESTKPILVAAHLPGYSHITILDREGRTVVLLNNRTIDPLEDVLTLAKALGQAAGIEFSSGGGKKQTFKTMDSYPADEHMLADAILAMANAIGTENPDSIAAVIFAHYDLEEFGPKERANDLELLPKLPAAMGGWTVRAWRRAEQGGVDWIYLLMRTDAEVSDEDADAQFILGMAAQPEAPDKVFHVFYHFDGFKVKN